MEITKIAIIGTGSMGSMMSLLFAEHGCQISVFDPSKKNRDLAISNAKKGGFESKVKAYDDYASLCGSLGSPKVFIFSVPHGTVGDSIVEQLHPYLERGDIIIDGSNEHWENTQRRQAKMSVRGVHYVGMGVSGGYQSARAGPSMSPGGDEPALNAIMPLLEKVAARDSNGKPCVAKMGPGGSGHYVKMVHNGIEQGMLSALCEVWGIMTSALGMSYEEVASTWEQWNNEGLLKSNFLLSIGIDICRRKDLTSSRPLLSLIRDKVVQDVDESEGTGAWTCSEGSRLHIPIPTISAAHQFRLASAYSVHRSHASKGLNNPLDPVQPITTKDKTSTISDLHSSLTAAFISSFIQGLNLLAAMNTQQGWQLDFGLVLSIWRGGCIIRSEGLSELLLPVYQKSGANTEALSDPNIAEVLSKALPALKRTVLLGLESNAHIPSLSATLEWIKYESTAEGMPTAFMEAQLDYFGRHMFELTTEEDSGKPETGEWHFGWKAAKGVPEKEKLVKL